MFVFNRPLGAVAAGLGGALLVVWLDGLSHPLDEVQRDARASDTPATLLQRTSRTTAAESWIRVTGFDLFC